MFKSLLHLVFPKICFVCASPLHQNEKHLCLACERNLPISGFPPSYNNPTAKVFRFRPQISWGYSLMEFYSGGFSQKVLHALKYQNARDIVEPLLKPIDFSPVFETYGKPNAIIPVPLHPKKLALRGYNQAQEIAVRLAEKIQVDCALGIIERTHYNKSQTHRNRLKRHMAGKQLFQLRNDPPKKLLIVDDVLTTGATLNSLMDCLPKSCEISVFTLARA
ncbi:MAG: ComF family protein [Luteibaculum sp.]